MVEFLRESISYKFGFPREIVTDQGAQFTSILIKDLMKKYHIKNNTSTTYEPQENGQVEVKKRSL